MTNYFLEARAQHSFVGKKNSIKLTTDRTEQLERAFLMLSINVKKEEMPHVNVKLTFLAVLTVLFLLLHESRTKYHIEFVHC